MPVRKNSGIDGALLVNAARALRCQLQSDWRISNELVCTAKHVRKTNHIALRVEEPRRIEA